MLSDSTKQRLRDPGYLELHMVAAALSKDLQRVPWYDAHFLKRFAVAKTYLGMVAPQLLPQFVDGFAPLQTAAGFAPVKLDDVLDPQEFADTVALANEIPRAKLETHELGAFGRHVVHDHPAFTQLQARLQPRVEAVLGRPLVAGYNFLSLYNGAGKCDPHLDEPFSMFTLDLCLEQNVDWPIWFSRIIDWSQAEDLLAIPPAQLSQRADLAFAPHLLQPNQALLFSGSAQWHYRDAIPAGGFCNLLFLHYYPAGAELLVRPHRWAEHFGFAELEPLCDLFAEVLVEGDFPEPADR